MRLRQCGVVCGLITLVILVVVAGCGSGRVVLPIAIDPASPPPQNVQSLRGHEQAGERNLSTPGVKDAITQTLKTRKEQLLRTAYLSAARGDADVVNHIARRLVASQGKLE